jgi:hypothetical protein
MASTSPPKPTAQASSKPLVPPEEQFWQRYSPHHEAVVSGVSSFTLHGLLVGLLVLGGALGLFAFLNPEQEPLEIGALGIPGGGGSPGIVGNPVDNPGGAVGGSENPVRPPMPEDEPEPAYQGPTLADLPRAEVRPQSLPEIASDPDFKPYLDNNNIALEKMSKIGQNARSQLIKGITGPGTGSGGVGTNPGGTGGGTGDGPGGVQGNIRTKRMARWVMILNNRTGHEYLAQLNSMGAALGLPQRDGQIHILRDLNARPAVGQPEDLAKLNRIFFADDAPETVRGLAQALGLPEVPPYIIAFFPEPFEKLLVTLEQRYQGLREDQIQETQFQMVRGRTGALEPRVVSQTRRK